MSYKTKYDISNRPAIQRGFLAIAGVLFVATAATLLFAQSAFWRYTLPTFTLFFVLITIVIPYWDHYWLASKLNTSECLSIEGKLVGYWRKDWYQHDTRSQNSYESFRIGSVQFGYHRLVEMAGFHNGEAHHIAIHNGLVLRINYVPELQFDDNRLMNRILKLEIMDSTTNAQFTRTNTLP